MFDRQSTSSSGDGANGAPERPSAKAFKKSPLSLQIDLSKFTPATEDEKTQQDVMQPSTTFFRDGMRKLMKNPLSVASLIVLVVIILFIIIAPFIIPYGYDEIIRVEGQRDKTIANLLPMQYSRMEQQYMADTGVKLFPHYMGTDDLGRDYLIRVVIGTRISLIVGLFASLIVLIIGLIYGSISGYLGGRADLIMMRIVDIIYSLPDLLLIILLQVVLSDSLKPRIQGTPLAAVGVNMISIFIVFGLLYWVSMARLVRGQILQIKKNEYVLAAESVGASKGRIIRKHILPNCISVIFISTALQIPAAIFTESFLSFIGLGVNVPMPSLGSLANSARQGLSAYPLKIVFPSVMICLLVLAFNLLGDGLRDAFDPKLKD